MAEVNYYDLHPGLGYGPFKFGSSIEDCRPYTEIYGERRERSMYPSEEALQFLARTMEMAGQPPGEIDKSVARVRENSLPQKEFYQVTFFGKGRVDLRFKRDKLITVTIDKGDISVFLGGQDLFVLDGFAIVEYVARQLNENPYVDVNDDDIYFRENSIALFGYSAGVENGSVRWSRPYDPKNPRPQRAIAIYDGPRRNNENFTDRFIYRII